MARCAAGEVAELERRIAEDAQGGGVVRVVGEERLGGVAGIGEPMEGDEDGRLDSAAAGGSPDWRRGRHPRRLGTRGRR